MKLKMNPKLHTALHRLRDTFHRAMAHPVLSFPGAAFVLTLMMEAFHRHELFGGFTLLIESPFMFLCNLLIILFTLSATCFFTRRGFAFAIVCFLWTVLGLINFYVMSYRITPIALIDLFLFRSAVTIMTVYFTPLELIGIFSALGFLCYGIYRLYKATPKRPVRWPQVAGGFLCLVLFGGLFISYAPSAEAISDTYGNLSKAYNDLGFTYCFSTSVVDWGIREPEDYTETEVIKAEASLPAEKTTGDVPNVIFLQLECFVDPDMFQDVTFDRVVTPNFKALKKAGSTGILSVPVVGGGTANTEFEVLTGMSLSTFGAGDFPYMTVLLDQTLDSLAYQFKSLGLSASVLHNHTRSFYDRDEVYPNLGFDRYISVEDMENVTYTPTGWAKDDVLKEEILSVLEASDSRDFIYTISVEGHGSYEGTEPEDREFTAYGDMEEELLDQWAYYATTLSHTDAFLGELVSALRDYPEPVVLVVYGDHLPSFDLNSGNVKTGDIFTTEYAIWSNRPMGRSYQDLTAYQLGAFVQQKMHLSVGTIPRLHQAYQFAQSPDWYEKLVLLSYDRIGGENYLWGGISPYLPTDLTH